MVSSRSIFSSHATAGALCCAALAACDDDSPAKKPPPSASVALSAETPAPTAKPFPTYTLPPDFEEIRLENEAPICVFSNYAAWQGVSFATEVKPQKLTAESDIVIGAFAPGCIHESCDARPSLQALTERDGNEIIVKTTYTGDRKKESHCTEECRSITAAGVAMSLGKGTYSIRYGDKTFKFKVPSVVRHPCFGLDR